MRESEREWEKKESFKERNTIGKASHFLSGLIMIVYIYFFIRHSQDEQRKKKIKINVYGMM